VAGRTVAGVEPPVRSRARRVGTGIAPGAGLDLAAARRCRHPIGRQSDDRKHGAAVRRRAVCGLRTGADLEHRRRTNRRLNYI